MRLEDQNITVKEDKDLPILDLDDMEDMELGEVEVDEVEIKPSKGKHSKVRRSIEDILEERELRRQLSDVFDEDILLD